MAERINCILIDLIVVVFSNAEVTIHYNRGLPVITAPLPSRAEKCQFTLLPVSNTVGDFLHMLSVEDKGVDRAAVYSPGRLYDLPFVTSLWQSGSE